MTMRISINFRTDTMTREQLARGARHIGICQQDYYHVSAGARMDTAQQFIEQVAMLSPKSIPILRQWPDDGYWENHSVEVFYNTKIAPRLDWLKKYKVVFAPNNESGNSAAYADWEDAANLRCSGVGVPLALGTWSTGTPELVDFPKFKRIFQSLETLGGVWEPHEYFGEDLLKSSGNPNRYEGFWKLCDSEGIARPTTVIGEFGLCGWVPGNPGYLDPHKGFRKLGIGSGDYARKYVIPTYQMWYEKNGVVVCVFCGGDWDGHGFDIDQMTNQGVDEGYYEAIEAFAQKQPVEVVTVPSYPPPVPKPADPGKATKVRADNELNLRDGPSTRHRDVGKPNEGEIKPGDTVLLWKDPKSQIKDGNGSWWCWCFIMVGPNANTQGWVCLSSLRYTEAKLSTEEQIELITQPTAPVEIPVKYKISQWVLVSKEITLPPSIAKLMLDAGLQIEAVSP